MKAWRCNFCQSISPAFGMTCSNCGHYGSLNPTEWIPQSPVRKIRCPKCSSKNYDAEKKVCSDCTKIKRKRRPTPESIAKRLKQ